VKLALAAVASLLILVAIPFQSAEAENPPRFVFGGAEVTRWWNDSHDPNITLTTGRQAAHYLNGLVVAYLRAMDRAQHNDLVWHWTGVAECESGGNWAINTGNGYYGGVQFSLETWRSVGGSGYPHQNSAGEQAYRADLLRQRSGLGQWPVCGSRYR
jgi:hypothetical protein